MPNQRYDLIVIGSGPGGYVAAIRAAQLRMKVAVIEKESVGGICLNWGCIPTKVLLKSADVFSTLKSAKKFGFSADNIAMDFNAIVKRSRQIATRMSKGVQFLFKKNNIDLYSGFGKLMGHSQVAVLDENGNDVEQLQANKIIIATGARPRSIPKVDIDRKNIITSREAMSLEKLPESMIVIGAGAIGIEFAYFYQTLGCQVTVVEMLPNILPVEDEEITDALTRSFKKLKMKIHTNSLVKKVTTLKGGVEVKIEADGESQTLQAEKALMAIGVQGNYEGMGLEESGVEIEKGYIQVDDSYRTSAENIYAIGDIIGPPWLAHVASAEAINAVERMAGKNVEPINYNNIPGCTYCKPQVASIGLTESKAKEQGFDVRIGQFPFVANGKSLALGESEGTAKLIFDKKTDKLLGAHILHAEATELISELSLLKSSDSKAFDLLKTIHPHPTLSEAIMEAGAAAYDEAVHL